MSFCETMMARIATDLNFLYNIVFSDEATFQLNGEVLDVIEIHFVCQSYKQHIPVKS